MRRTGRRQSAVKVALSRFVLSSHMDREKLKRQLDEAGENIGRGVRHTSSPLFKRATPQLCCFATESACFSSGLVAGYSLALACCPPRCERAQDEGWRRYRPM